MSEIKLTIFSALYGYVSQQYSIHIVVVNCIKEGQTLQHTVVSSTFHYDLDTCVVLGIVCIGRYNYNYHAIVAMTIETTTP
jgi:hypothetical protein